MANDGALVTALSEAWERVKELEQQITALEDDRDEWINLSGEFEQRSTRRRWHPRARDRDGAAAVSARINVNALRAKLVTFCQNPGGDYLETIALADSVPVLCAALRDAVEALETVGAGMPRDPEGRPSDGYWLGHSGAFAIDNALARIKERIDFGGEAT